MRYVAGKRVTYLGQVLQPGQTWPHPEKLDPRRLKVLIDQRIMVPMADGPDDAPARVAREAGRLQPIKNLGETPEERKARIKKARAAGAAAARKAKAAKAKAAREAKAKAKAEAEAAANEKAANEKAAKKAAAAAKRAKKKAAKEAAEAPPPPQPEPASEPDSLDV